MSRDRIHTYFNCAECAREKPVNISHRKNGRVTVGLTPEGVQVWCVRHDREIVTLTPEELRNRLALGPQCSCCPDGLHRS